MRKDRRAWALLMPTWLVLGIFFLAPLALTLVLSFRRAWFPHVLFAILVITSVAAASAIVAAPVDTSLLPSDLQK